MHNLTYFIVSYKPKSFILVSFDKFPIFLFKIIIKGFIFTGWDKIQTIDSLLRKGGYRGHVTPETRRSLKLTRYQSETVSVSFQDYMNHVQTLRC